ncbi:GNAT family N-acetyltransferase [Eudoraea adriatica]|uniref:GNAT family N-acetyltransferase n=1 Tax=Eudoraea adriatica TaxID=446681 RepID=UPI001969BC53|nr:GNAT family N-acetyltransferase [Eudoraea adriatica]
MMKKYLLLSSTLILLFSTTMFSQNQPFVPSDFKIPDTLENQHFRIRMLTVNDVVKDYDAVMTSIENLQKMFPLSSWPSRDLSFEQDLIDLGWHQKEFQIRSSFAYTVVLPDESEVIGCLYINPTTKGDYDAQITMWIRTSMLDKGLDAILFNSVREWIEKDWPFQKVAYPGREISWEDWKVLK